MSYCSSLMNKNLTKPLEMKRPHKINSKQLNLSSTAQQESQKSLHSFRKTKSKGSNYLLPLQISEHEESPYPMPSLLFRSGTSRVPRLKIKPINRQNKPIIKTEPEQEQIDFEKFYSIGKRYWNVDDSAESAKVNGQLPYIKNTVDKYDFNSKYFKVDRKPGKDRESFQKMKQVCAELHSKQSQESLSPYQQYSEIAKQSLKQSIKVMKHMDDSRYAKEVVDKIYEDEYQSIHEQLDRIHRIKQRHSLIQRIKLDRKRLLEKYHERAGGRTILHCV